MCGLKNYFYVVIVVWLCFLVHVGSMCSGILRGEFFCITFMKTFLFWKKHLCSRAQIHRVFHWLLWEDAIRSVSYLRKLPTSKTPWLQNLHFQLSPALGLEMFTNFRQLPITGELESGYLGGIMWTLTCHFACKAVLKGTFDILILKEQEKVVERERYHVLCSRRPLEGSLPLVSDHDLVARLVYSICSSFSENRTVFSRCCRQHFRSFHGGKRIQFSLLEGESVRITLFLKIILFALGCGQASHVGAVCCVTNLRPQRPTFALSVRSRGVCIKQAMAFGRLQGAKKEWCSWTCIRQSLWADFFETWESRWQEKRREADG